MSSREEKKDIQTVLIVHWALTRFCTGACSYCCYPRSDDNLVLIKERLIRIAWRIISTPAVAYNITLTGTEPTKHPFLPELMSYLLGAPRNVRITIETNGELDLLRWQHLPNLKNSCFFRIFAHPAKADPNALTLSLGKLNDVGAAMSVTLVQDGAHQQKTDYLNLLLSKLADKLSFSYYTVSPQDIFPDIRTQALPSIVFDDKIDDVWTVADANVLSIDPQGRLIENISKVPHGLPLWNDKAESPGERAQIVQVPRDVLSGVNASLPSFTTRNNAELWLNEWQEQKKLLQAELEPLPDPDGASFGGERIVHMRLKRLTTQEANPWQGNASIQNCIKDLTVNPQPELLGDRGVDLGAVFDATNDEISRTVWLEGIKAIASGDPTYIRTVHHPERMPNTRGRTSQPQFLAARRLELGEAQTGVGMAAFRDVLRERKPTVHIRLDLSPESLIDVPLALLSFAPGYQLRFGRDESASMWLYAVHPCSPDMKHVETWLEADSQPLVSVIVPAHNDASTLERALDSVLVQLMEHIELVVVDDASTDSTPTIIDEYTRRYPHLIRALRLPECMGAGAARNEGLRLAMGKYVTFIDADDMLAEDFLSDSVRIMEKERADIVAFGLVFRLPNSKEELWGVEAGKFSGADSLRHILLKKAGSYGAYAKLYRREMLWRYSITFGTTAVHEDMFFIVKAFFHSALTVVVPQPGYYKHVRTNSLSQTVKNEPYFLSFVEFIAFLTRFFINHSLALDDGYLFAIHRVYTWDRPRVLAAISHALETGSIGDLLSDDNLSQLAHCRVALEYIIRDYAELACCLNPQPLLVQEEDRNWRKAASVPWQGPICEAYGTADTPASPAPLLSVIVPNYNKADYLVACLNSIIHNGYDDFEIIIVDDASTDGSWSILCDYADLFAMIRLYKVSPNSRQGVARNIGLDRARGKYIVFVDSDDNVEEGFFFAGIDMLERTNADLVMFSCKHMDIEGNELQKREMADKEIPINERLDFLSEPWAKVFRADYLRENQIRFAENIYHQDHFFTAQALLKAKKVIASSLVAYRAIQTPNSSIRPASRRYLHVYSARKYYEFLAELYEQHSNASLFMQVRWNVENIFLPAVLAFLHATGEIPFSESDWESLSNNMLFLRVLVIGFATLQKKRPAPVGLLATFTSRERTPWIRLKPRHPIVTVIVPVYNQERLLRRCLDSIKDQSLRSLEIIVVDDASTDRSLAVANAAAKVDGRIKVIANPVNMGQGNIRTRALNMCSGEFITFLDSDDYLFDFLLHGTAQLRQYPEVDFIQFARVEKDGEKEIVHRDYPDHVLLTDHEYFKKYLTGSSWWNGVAKIYRKQFITDNQIAIPGHLFEDNVFIMQAYSAAKNVLVDPAIAYAQMRTPHEASAMRPFKLLPRHVSGYLATAADISRFLRERVNPALAAEVSIGHITQPVMLPKILEAVSAMPGWMADSLTEEDCVNLNAAPELCHQILKDFAALWLKNQKTPPALSQNERVVTPRRPAEYLMPIIDHDSRDTPRLSVIVPAWNVEGSLKASLDSVLDQNFSGYELILIEDNSTDYTFQICREMASASEKIRLFRTPWNSGLGTVRNLGIEAARGEYITFLDSDDWFAPGFLPAGLHLMDSAACDMGSFSVGSKYKDSVEWHIKPDAERGAYEASLDHMSGKFRHWGAWGRIYRRDFLNRHALRFSHFIYEDVLFMLQAYACSGKHMYFSHKAFCSDRSNEKSIMHNPEVNSLRFESQVHNLVNVAKIFCTQYNAEQARELQAKYLDWIGHPAHTFTRDVLGYVGSCEKAMLPDPLTEDVMADLRNVPGFMPFMFINYARLYASIQKK